jgi:hypothetical protein
MEINYISAMAGAGKTQHIIQNIKSLIESKENVIIAQPTQKLIDQLIKDLKIEGIQSIREVTSNNLKAYPWATNTTNALLSELKSNPHNSVVIESDNILQGKLIITTHISLFGLTPSDHMSDWNLYIDEVPNITKMHTIDLEKGNQESDLKDIERFINLSDNSKIIPVIGGEHKLKDICAGVNGTSYKYQSDSFKELCRSLLCKNQDIELIRKEDKTERLNFISEYSYTTLSMYKKITLVASNVEKSFLYKLWSKDAVRFVEDLSFIGTKEGHPAHDGLIKIFYLFEKTFSKRKHMSPYTNKGTIDAIFTTAIDFFTKRNVDWYFCANTSIVDFVPKDIEKRRIKVVSHGLNDYKDSNGFAFLCAINSNPTMMTYYNSKGLSSKEVKIALTVESAYQAVCRTSIRKTSPDGQPKYLIVGYRELANLLKDNFIGATTEKITGLEEFESKDNGRPRATYTTRVLDRVLSMTKRKENGKKLTSSQLSWLGEHANGRSLSQIFAEVTSYHMETGNYCVWGRIITKN